MKVNGFLSPTLLTFKPWFWVSNPRPSSEYDMINMQIMNRLGILRMKFYVLALRGVEP
jgi:hypothetical protein